MLVVKQKHLLGSLEVRQYLRRKDRFTIRSVGLGAMGCNRRTLGVSARLVQFEAREPCGCENRGRRPVPRPDRITRQQRAAEHGSAAGGRPTGVVIRMSVVLEGGDQQRLAVDPTTQSLHQPSLLALDKAVREAKSDEAATAETFERVGLLGCSHRSETGDAGIGGLTVGDGDHGERYPGCPLVGDQPSCP